MINTHSKYVNDFYSNHRISQKGKDGKNKAYYKHWSSIYANYTIGYNQGFYDQVKEYYDLVSGKVDLSQYKHVYNRHKVHDNNVPVKFKHRDIISETVKRLQGLEMGRLEAFRLLAVNPEATTRREEDEFNKYRNYVLESLKGTFDENNTPDKIRKYMNRKHLDIAETYGNQILNYIKQDQKTQYKFNRAWYHGMCSGIACCYTGIINKKSVINTVNSLYLDYDKAPDNPFIHKGQWVTYYNRMTTSQLLAIYDEDLTKAEIKKLQDRSNKNPEYGFTPETFGQTNNSHSEENLHIVAHSVWKGFKKVGILTHIDAETREIVKLPVNEDYKLDTSIGDIDLEWRWVQEVHECTRIDSDIFVNMRPIPNQEFDLDSLGEEKDLPYVGVVLDDVNSMPVSIVGRMASYQYLYNIILYRIEKLMASDKGKILLQNIDIIPDNDTIDISKWHYYAEANQLGWFSFAQEGNKYGEKDINKQSKLVDMSLTSDIDKYIKLAGYIENKAKKLIGITEQFEGNIQAREGQRNVQHSINASNAALEPYYYLHSVMKTEVLTKALSNAKYALVKYKPKNLYYYTDDIGAAMVNLDFETLKESKYGLFIRNGSKDEQVKQQVQEYASLMVQRESLELSDLAKFLKAEDLNSAVELLEVGEGKKQEKLERIQKMSDQAASEREDSARNFEIEMENLRHQNNMELEDKKIEGDILEASITGIGFDENKDRNNNNVPDIIEYAKSTLEEKKFNHQVKQDKKTAEQRDKELDIKEKEANNKKSAISKK